MLIDHYLVHGHEIKSSASVFSVYLDGTLFSS